MGGSRKLHLKEAPAQVHPRAPKTLGAELPNSVCITPGRVGWV